MRRLIVVARKQTIAVHGVTLTDLARELRRAAAIRVASGGVTWREAVLCHDAGGDHRFNNSGSLAMLTAMRRASLRASRFAADRRGSGQPMRTDQKIN